MSSSSHHHVDKSLLLGEGLTGVRLAAGDAFAPAGTPTRWAPDPRLRVLDLEVHLKVDPAHPGVEGRTRVALQVHPRGLTAPHPAEVALHLRDQRVARVHREDGGPLTWSHADGQLRLQGLPEGEPVVIWVEHAGVPQRGLYHTGPASWDLSRPAMAWTQCQDTDAQHLFPCVDHPSVKAPVRLVATVPAGLEVVGNGRLESVSPAGDAWSRWTWREDRPIPAYLFTLVVGPMVVVHDEAPESGPDGGPLPLRYLAPAGADPAALRKAFGRTPEMVRALVRLTGVPFPYPRYDQVVVHDFIFGGMENAGATTLTELCLMDDRALIDGDMDDLIVHELAHQWFGDLVTCADWSQAWLNEGWATLVQALWLEVHEGPDAAHAMLMELLDHYLAEHNGRYQRALVERRYEAPIDLFDRHLYEKAALVLHTLRHQCGDGAFWAGVRAYLGRHADGVVVTDDLRAALEQASGRSLERAFAERVHGVGHPELKVKISWDAGLLRIDVEQLQTGPRVPEAFELELPLFVELADGTTEARRLPAHERRQSLLLACPSRPLRVGVDPQFTALTDLKIEAPVDLLAASLGRDEGAIGRVRAARALARLPDAGGVAALAEALPRPDHWFVRAELAAALGSVGGPVARAALLAALADAEPRVRRAAAQALGAPGHPDVQAALAEALSAGDPSLRVEAELAAALGRSRAPGARPALEAAAGRPSWSDLITRKSLEGLGASADPAALPTLIAHTDAALHPRIVAAAASALGALLPHLPEGRAGAVGRLCDLARGGAFRVRLAAITALGGSGSPAARGTLAAIAGAEPDPRTRRMAAEALRRLDADPASSPLKALQDDLKAAQARAESLEDRLRRLEARIAPA
jgi:aminopeptidase N